jgi:hypothetical protein
MLFNYKKLHNGVIAQIDREEFRYGFDYSNAYNNLGELGMQMAYLRLGYFMGVVNENIDSLLDVGYGNGDFLKAATNYIPNCYGNDVENNYPLPSNVEYVNSIYGRHYTLITMFDVLEHLPDIYSINKLQCDYLYVSLPWCHYFSDGWFDKWKHRKPNEHLYHFNDTSLCNFMDEVGFECIAISNIEDCIRKPVDENKNILSGIFKKRKDS